MKDLTGKDIAGKDIAGPDLTGFQNLLGLAF